MARKRLVAGARAQRVGLVLLDEAGVSPSVLQAVTTHIEDLIKTCSWAPSPGGERARADGQGVAFCSQPSLPLQQGSSVLKNNEILKSERRYREWKNPLKPSWEGVVDE